MNAQSPIKDLDAIAQDTMSNAKLIDVAALEVYSGNARTHSRRQIKKIAASIERFGFINPVLVDGSLQIIAGHGRVAAAKLLGLKQVPSLQIEHLSDAEKRAYVLADNRLAEEAGWDKEILAIELQGLLDIDFSIELTGFDASEIDVVLDEAAAKIAPEEDLDDVLPSSSEAAVTTAGDCWLLGGHKLLCGDATDPASFQVLMGRSKASMVFTDPPYNVPISGHVSGLGKHQHREFEMASGEMCSDEFVDFLQTVFTNLENHSSDGSIHFVCMDWRHTAETLSAGHSVYTELKNICVWVKSNGGMGSFYRSRHEFVLVFKSGSGEHVNNFELGQHGRYRTNVWQYAGVSGFGRDRNDALEMHPTVKPVALVADAIRDCSKRNQIVLDPFAGSGTTLIAAEKTGRKARLIEIDPVYCDTVIKRWQSITGKSAILSGTNQSYEEIEEMRSLEAAGDYISPA